MSRIEKYRACAARGMTIMETARLYRVTPSAIRHANTTHKLGFPVTGWKQPKRDMTAMRERLTALAAQGKTRREISVEMQVSADTISRWKKQWGVKIGKYPGFKKPVLSMVQDRLTTTETDDLLLLKRKGYSFRDAFVAMRRPDLLEYLP